MLMYLIDMELLFLCFGRARALFLLFVVECFLPANFALCILGWLFMFSIRGFFGSFLFLFSGGGWGGALVGGCGGCCGGLCL